MEIQYWCDVSSLDNSSWVCQMVAFAVLKLGANLKGNIRIDMHVHDCAIQQLQKYIHLPNIWEYWRCS